MAFTTYYYNGAGSVGSLLGPIVTGASSKTYWFALTVKYGTFLEATNFSGKFTNAALVDPPSMIGNPTQPQLAPHVTIWNTGNKTHIPKLVAQSDIQDLTGSNLNNFSGAIFLYQCPPFVVGGGTYYVIWTIPSFTVLYGTERISVQGTNGQSASVTV